MSINGSLDLTSGSGRLITLAPVGSEIGYINGPDAEDELDEGYVADLMLIGSPSYAAPTVERSGSIKSFTSVNTSLR